MTSESIGMDHAPTHLNLTDINLMPLSQLIRQKEETEAMTSESIGMDHAPTHLNLTDINLMPLSQLIRQKEETEAMTSESIGMDHAPTHLNLTDINLMPLSQLIRQKEETEADVEKLCKLMYVLNTDRLKYESAIENVNFVNSTLGRLNTGISPSRNINVQGEIRKISNLIMNLEDDYHPEMDKESAINHILRKVQKIKAKISVAHEILATKILIRERLRKAAVLKYLEQKKMAENSPV